MAQLGIDIFLPQLAQNFDLSGALQPFVMAMIAGGVTLDVAFGAEGTSITTDTLPVVVGSPHSVAWSTI